LNWADKALIGITIVALLAVVVPISIGLAGEDDDLNVTGNFLLNSVYGQTDFGATSSATTSEFESFTGDSLTSVEPMPYVFNGQPQYEFDPFGVLVEIPQPVRDPMVTEHTLPTASEVGGQFYDSSIPDFDFESTDSDTDYVQYWHMTQTDDSIQVNTLSGKVTFDKSNGAMTIFANLEDVEADGTAEFVKVDSDSFVVRGAPIDTDNWFNLSVNDSPVTYTIDEREQKAVVTFTKTNSEGTFDLVTEVYNNHFKSTAYFSNSSFTDHKFAFTETVALPDSILKLNSEDIDLSLYIGQSFPREVLEDNMDLVLEVEGLGYHSGVGFDNLWQVNIHENNTVSLDYANVGNVITPIGGMVELDPSWDWSRYGTGDAAGNMFSYPMAIDQFANGDFIVCSSDANYQGCHKYDKGGDYINTFTTATNPAGIHIDEANGEVWTNSYMQNVKKFDLNGNMILSSFGGNSLGIDIFVDSEDNLWMSNFSTGISKYDSSRNLVFGGMKSFGGDSCGSQCQAFFAEDLDGNIWVSMSYKHKLYKIDKAGNHLLTTGPSIQTVGAGLTYPNHIDIDKNTGNLWVVAEFTYGAMEFDKYGNFLQRVGGQTTGMHSSYPAGLGYEDGKFKDPMGLSVYDGKLYIVDYLGFGANEGAIQRIDIGYPEPDKTPSYISATMGYGDRFAIYDASYGAGTQTACSGSTTWTKQTGNQPLYQVMPATTTNNNACYMGGTQFPLANIPSDAIITDVSMKFNINSSPANPPTCDFVHMATNNGDIRASSVSATDIYNEITSTGTTLARDDSSCSGEVGDAQSVNLGTNGIVQLQNSLDNNHTYFAVGQKVSNDTRTANNLEGSYINQTLLVSYTEPPTAPTLTATYNNGNADLSWTAVTDGAPNKIISPVAEQYTAGTTNLSDGLGDYGIRSPVDWTIIYDMNNVVRTPTAPTTSQSNAVLGSSMFFNGFSDVLGHDNISGGSSNLTDKASVSVWIKPMGSPYVSGGGSVGNPLGVMSNGGAIYFVQNGQWSSYYPLDSFSIGSVYSNGNAFNMYEWNHLVISGDSSSSANLSSCAFSSCVMELDVYMNGQKIQMYSYPSGTGGGTASNATDKGIVGTFSNFVLGAQHHPSPLFKYPFHGYIDEFANWNTTLTQADVTALYNDGKGNLPSVANKNSNLVNYLPLDDSSFPIQNHAIRDIDDVHSDYIVTPTAYDALKSSGTSIGNPFKNVEGIYGSAWEFSGQHSKEHVNDVWVQFPNERSISQWFNFELADYGYTIGGNSMGELSTQANGGGYSWSGAIPAGTFSDNTWHHVVQTKDVNNNTKLYVDGTQILTGSLTWATMTTPKEFCIGISGCGVIVSGGGTHDTSRGMIDEIAMYERELTSSEVTALYNSGKSAHPTAISVDGLTHYFNFEQLGDQLTNMAVVKDPTLLKYDVIKSSSGDVNSFDTSTEVGFTTSANTITKDSGSSGWGDSKIQSTQTFTTGAPFSFDFSPSTSSATGYIGLGQGTLEHNNGSNKSDSMKFAYFIAGESKVYELSDTTAKYIQGSFNASDNYRISVEADGTVKYYRQASGTGAFNLEYTSANTASGTYYVQSNMNTNGQGFIDMSYSSGLLITSTTGTTYSDPISGGASDYTIEAGVGQTTMLASLHNPQYSAPAANTHATNGATECTTTGSHTSWVWYSSNYVPWFGTWNGCRVSGYEWDVSSIPDSATILDVDVEYDIGFAADAPLLKWTSQEQQLDNGLGGTNPYTSSTDAWNDAHNNVGINRNGITYASHQMALTTGMKDLSLDLGEVARDHVKAQLTDATSVNGVGDWFGMYSPFVTDGDHSGTLKRLSTANVELNVTYAMDNSATSNSQTVTPPPPAPTGLTATVNAPNVDLSWTASTGATSYKIETSTDDITYTTLVADTGNTNVTYSHTAPVQNTTNYYKVYAIGSAGMSGANTATTDVTTSYDTIIIRNNNCTTGTSEIYPQGEKYGVGRGTWNDQCYRAFLEFDTTSIPDTATITDTVFKFEVSDNQNAPSTRECEVIDAGTTIGTDTFDAKWTAVSNGSVIGSDSICTSVGTNRVINLDSSANTLIQNKLSSDYFTFGLRSSDEVTLGQFVQIYTAAAGSWPNATQAITPHPTLSLTHTAPSSLAVGGIPDAPTGLTTTFNNSTMDMDLAWTAPVNNNGSAVTGYKIETSTNGTWSTVITTTNTNTTYSHTGPVVGSVNYYKVSAINAYGTSSFVSEHTVDPTSSSGNTIITFNSDTTFSPTSSFDVEYLVVAGGGGGGGSDDTPAGSGGGAGGLRTDTIISATVQGYDVIVGTGGNGGTGNVRGTSGTDSTFGSITSSGGGGACAFMDYTSFDGGSGGGVGWYCSGGIGNTPSTTPSQGNNGGVWASPDANYQAGVGGGGSGSAGYGVTANTQNGSNGGDGTTSSITGLTYAGGGAGGSGGGTSVVATGGTGGSGGGGAGGNTSTTGTDGTSGTDGLGAGGGGGGGFYAYTNGASTGGDGGSGVVIVKFVTSGNNYLVGNQVGALAGGPPDAPTNLTVSYNSPNADLTWVAPTVTNGSAVIGYKVETSLDNLSWSPVTVLTNTNVTYSHTNPTVGADNYYRVSAINSIGTGVPGNVASVLAAIVPTAPLTLTTTQTVPFAHDLSWSVPSNDGGSPVTNYKVYRDGSLITTLGNVTTYQDNTMQHIAHTHSYEVSAVNLVGESPMSNASSITSWNVPDATTGVTATARAGQQNELNWTAPNNGGSPITGYHIKSSTDNITFTDVVATTTTQPYNHTGLTQGATYYYQISAISAVGEGAFGTASATVGDVPDAPVSLTVVPQAGMQATITITIPNDNGYAISSYTLHRSSDNFATFTVLNSQTSNVIVDYPLNIGTSYQYKALATNSLGDSALSVASATALAGDVPSTPVAPGTVVATT